MHPIKFYKKHSVLDIPPAYLTVNIKSSAFYILLHFNNNV